MVKPICQCSLEVVIDMNWSLMDAQEVHAFGIQTVLPYIQKEDVKIESVNPELAMNPQIVGQRWGTLAFIFVRTALYPDKGELTDAQFMKCLRWADEHNATAFFASVGIACRNYPDKSPIDSDADMRLPIKNAGFAVAYEGLTIMTTSDRVRE